MEGLHHPVGAIDGTYLNHLRFTDDIVLISSDPKGLKFMLGQLHEKSVRVGLKINLQKTKILGPENVRISVGNQALEVVYQNIYLGHNIKIGKANQAAKVTRRVGLT